MGNNTYYTVRDSIETNKIEQFLINVNAISELLKPEPDIRVLQSSKLIV